MVLRVEDWFKLTHGSSTAARPRFMGWAVGEFGLGLQDWIGLGRENLGCGTGAGHGLGLRHGTLQLDWVGYINL